MQVWQPIQQTTQLSAPQIVQTSQPLPRSHTITQSIFPSFTSHVYEYPPMSSNTPPRVCQMNASVFTNMSPFGHQSNMVNVSPIMQQGNMLMSSNGSSHQNYAPQVASISSTIFSYPKVTQEKSTPSLSNNATFEELLTIIFQDNTIHDASPFHVLEIQEPITSYTPIIECLIQNPFSSSQSVENFQ